MEDKRFELRAELVTVEISDPQTGKYSAESCR